MNAPAHIGKKVEHLLSNTTRRKIAQRTREDEAFAKRRGMIAPNDCYRYRVQYIGRGNGLLFEGPMFDTQIEALEAMHRKPVSKHWIALGVVQCRTFCGEQAA